MLTVTSIIKSREKEIGDVIVIVEWQIVRKNVTQTSAEYIYHRY